MNYNEYWGRDDMVSKDTVGCGVTRKMALNKVEPKIEPRTPYRWE